MLGTVMLAFQYFVIVPVFALLAKRAARRETEGFVTSRIQPQLQSQY